MHYFLLQEAWEKNKKITSSPLIGVGRGYWRMATRYCNECRGLVFAAPESFIMSGRRFYIDGPTGLSLRIAVSLLTRPFISALDRRRHSLQSALFSAPVCNSSFVQRCNLKVKAFTGELILLFLNFYDGIIGKAVWGEHPDGKAWRYLVSKVTIQLVTRYLLQCSNKSRCRQ